MKKKSKKAFVSIVFLIAAALLLSFHSAWAAKQIELRFASAIPAVANTHKVWEGWAKQLEERSKGRVKITFYPAQSLVKILDNYSSVEKGICDIGYQINAMEPSRFRLALLMDMPLVGWKSVEMATRIRNDLFKKFPEVRAETKEVKVLWQNVLPPWQPHSRKKAVRVPDDMKGMKLIGLGVTGKYLASIGAAPVPLPPSEWYMGLSRGVAEGVAAPYHVCFLHKIHKLLPYHLDINFGYPGSMVLMNLDRWNGLPADIQKIIKDLKPWIIKELVKANTKELEWGKKMHESIGQTFITPTTEQLSKWQESSKKLHEKWITDNEAKGLPARAIYNEAQRLIKQYSK